MAELEGIAEVLRRQRQDIKELMGKTVSRRSETAELLGRIEDLRVRSEDTLRRVRLSIEAVEMLNGDDREDERP